jgi:hypothetical protein
MSALEAFVAMRAGSSVTGTDNPRAAITETSITLLSWVLGIDDEKTKGFDRIIAKAISDVDRIKAELVEKRKQAGGS